MIDEFRNKPCVYGGTLSTVIDATPDDLISRVYLEHKMFETWFHKRSVLIGDGNCFCLSLSDCFFRSTLTAFFLTGIANGLLPCTFDG